MGYENERQTRMSPSVDVTTITPNDTTVLPDPKALRVFNPATTAATVRVLPSGRGPGGATVDLLMPPGLTIEPIGVLRVHATGTTAGLTIHGYL